MSGRIMARISAIHLDWKRFVSRGLAAHGISPKQIFVLRKLSEADGLNPSEIADLLHADRPTATVMIDTLARRGWIARHRSTADAKRVVVTLTPAGRRKLRSVPERLWRSGRMPVDPESCLSPDECAQLGRLIDRIHSHILAGAGRR
jgi:DNA-binding MarR family transcriptional regulator